uniref:Uncharacterized protein n=1 Tax=Pseudonaja textilis TaxID=8673 RepID=A0A670Y955_PSETE
MWKEEWVWVSSIEYRWGRKGHSLNTDSSDPRNNSYLTSRWERVKMTGSIRKTRLDSLLMEAAITWELTTSEGLSGPTSLPSLIVAFSVERKNPKLL